MKLKLTAILLICISLYSCFEEETYNDNTKRGNFEALWSILDQNYCFFEYKGVNWDDVHERYSQRITPNMSYEALFDVMTEMLAELKDGHVNLTAAHNVARYWNWHEDFPDNFDSKIQRNYLGTDYGIASGLKYKILSDNIGYIYYASFSDGIGEGNLDEVLSRMSICNGIIIDIRNNGGGMLSNSDKLASRFFNEKTLIGYIQHKTGKGHADFSKPYPKYIEPSNRIRYQKTVAVLTNRRSYSSANDFVNAMKYAPYSVIVGDQTGGGGGLPFTSELPNGWSVRFSASPMLNAQKQHIEFGIEPDLPAEMTAADMADGKDSIIEAARAEIKRVIVSNNRP